MQMDGAKITVPEMPSSLGVKQPYLSWSIWQDGDTAQ